MNDSTGSAHSTLRGYLAALRRQWVIVVAVLLVSLLAAALWIARQDSQYASQMKIVVGQGEALFGPDVSFAVEPFTQTMTDLLESDIVARRVIDDLDLDSTPSELLDRLEVTTKPDASVLNLTYEDSDRARSRRVLQQIGQEFTELVDSRFGQEEAPANGQAQTAPVSATIFDPAHVLPDRVSPKPLRTLAIAGVLGLIAGVLLALVRDAFANRIRSHRDAQDAFGVRVAGVLPPGTVGTRPSQLEHLPPPIAQRIGDSLEILGATLRFSSNGSESGVVLVTSSLPEEGKTTIVANVAAMMARSGLRVIAVEGDLRRPALHRYLEVAPDLPGLTDIARGEVSLDDVLVSLPVPASLRDGHTLTLLPAGRRLAESHDVFTMGYAAKLVAQLRELADYVIFDSAPLLLVPDAYPLAQLADRVLVVAREDTTSRDDAESARETLRSLSVRDFTVILTEATEAERRPYGYEAAPS
jgi:Mrp family chromosome partitioning ATPase/capsular polysaccharide biosynthesis protein